MNENNPNTQPDRSNSSPCLGFGMSGKPQKIENIHEASFRDYYQRIEGDTLQVLLFLPGVDTEALVVRNNPKVLLVSTRYRADLVDLFSCNCPIDIRIKLIEEIIPKSTIAEYKDGILKFEFQIK